MSEWKEGAARRRDERATKRQDIFVKRMQATRKNTRRWCKGVNGREHQLIIEMNPKYWTHVCNTRSWISCWHHEVCTVCGKEVRAFLPLKECPILNGAKYPNTSVIKCCESCLRQSSHLIEKTVDDIVFLLCDTCIISK